ncbi:hypothetical protein Xmir_01011 [Xenorhabdus miraniensis]|uniref:Uncharacterized protein n=1 Tax=Xenorhabdus miraniensis TaxID=351674 RepID=A0A2D0JUY1_9GAMM|nr:hypothetical protein Xmir_01011 [Xenorhabdus miraniensis]
MKIYRYYYYGKITYSQNLSLYEKNNPVYNYSSMLLLTFIITYYRYIIY